MGYDAVGPGLAGATKEMVMSFPIDVLCPASANDLAQGSLMYAGDSWWLRLDLTDEDDRILPRILALTGSRLGQITMLSNPTVSAVNSKYGWEFRINDPMATEPNISSIGAITIGENGTIGIWAHAYGDVTDVHCISPGGYEISDESVRKPSYVKYGNFEVWLIDKKTGSTIGDRPLFTQIQTKTDK
ncbi:TPA: hypothetical protein ACXNG6_000162 [Stenotrophomonas maltophilia]